MKTDSHIRPSILPKLAQCGHFESEEKAGEAAERGNRIDRIFRDMIEKPLCVPEGDPEEVALAAWAARTVFAMTSPVPAEASESACAMSCDVGLSRPLTGTGDAICSPLQVSFDLKSGQIRNYKEQQAAYALGYMDAYFCNEWTVHLLFCDEERVITYRFTRESAEETIHDALALWRGGVPPVTNEYCGWCSKRFTCPTRKEELGQWLEPLAVTTQDPKGILAGSTSEQLVSFCLLGRKLEPWVEEARRLLLERIDGGAEIPPGVVFVNKSGSRKVAPINLLDLVEPAVILAACDMISEAKAKEIFPDLKDELVTQLPGRREMHLKAPKPPKAEGETKPKRGRKLKTDPAP